jgi:hypothetical protein
MDPRALPISATALLSSDEHDALTQWCGWAAGELGHGSIAAQEVLRGLVARLLPIPNWPVTYSPTCVSTPAWWTL